jgi:hypothetical protein
MVWVNPLGQKALQVHGIAVRKMFLKATPTSEVKVVDDVVEIRKLLHNWQERVIKPEYVLMAPVEEGDVQMWDNWVSLFPPNAVPTANNLLRVSYILLLIILTSMGLEVCSFLPLVVSQ